MNNKTQERVYIESLLFSDRTYSFPEIYTLVVNKFPNKSISETKVRNIIGNIRRSGDCKEQIALVERRTEFLSNLHVLDSALSIMIDDVNKPFLFDRVDSSNIPLDLYSALNSKAVELKQLIATIEQCGKQIQQRYNVEFYGF